MHTSITKIQTRVTDYITDCSNLIARIQQYGTNLGFSGPITANVWLASQQPARYVKRFFQIDPSISSGTGAKRITLYFTQQEFTDFNAVNTVKLPIDAADAANNKANLLIEKSWAPVLMVQACRVPIQELVLTPIPMMRILFGMGCTTVGS
nr:hypothetical protein [Paraflavitalea speifideiaquila]